MRICSLGARSAIPLISTPVTRGGGGLQAVKITAEDDDAGGRLFPNP